MPVRRRPHLVFSRRESVLEDRFLAAASWRHSAIILLIMDSYGRLCMPALLMDLDGTIADTLPHLFASFRDAVAPFVARMPTDAEIIASFGPPERDCIMQILYECNDTTRTVVPQDLDRAVRRF